MSISKFFERCTICDSTPAFDGLCEKCYNTKIVCTKPCGMCGAPVANERETICERCKEFWMNMINRKCNTCRYHLKSTTMCVGCKHHPALQDMYTPIE